MKIISFNIPLNRSILFFLFLCIFGFSAFAKNPTKPTQTEAPVKESGLIGSFFKNKEIDFFPVPVFQTRPDEGVSYGAMPVVLFSEKETKAIKVILALIGQYNEHKKVSFAHAGYFFPNPTGNPDQVFDYYFEWAQKFYREAGGHYLNPHMGEHFFLEASLIWMQTPYTRFFGYGPATTDAAESDYLFNNFNTKITFGYYILPQLRVNLSERLLIGDVKTRAITSVADTLTNFGALPGVRDSTTLVHRVSLTFDNRPTGINSKRGTFAEIGYITSLNGFVSDATFNGYSLEAVQLIPWLKERTITALRFSFQDLYGSNIPMYLQSTLGGDKELRSYMPNRFVDKSKAIFQVEQRIRLIHKAIFGIPVEFYADPFFEIGKVFNNLENFSLSDLQPVGGIGLRGVVPPNVVGRLDIGIGKNGYNVYTQLGYPF
jgi:hypothetical protein